MIKFTFDWRHSSRASGPVKDFRSWPEELDLTEWAVNELEKIPELAGLEETIWQITAIAKFYGQKPLDSDFSSSLRKARQALDRFVDEMNAAGPWASRVIMSPSGSPAPERKSDYRFQYQDELFQLQEFVANAEKYSTAIEEYFEKNGPKPGRSINTSAATVARHVADLFADNDRPLSSYEGGLYMKTLCILFADIFPNIGGEAYRRHGRSAIKDAKDSRTK